MDVVGVGRSIIFAAVIILIEVAGMIDGGDVIVHISVKGIVVLVQRGYCLDLLAKSW